MRNALAMTTLIVVALFAPRASADEGLVTLDARARPLREVVDAIADAARSVAGVTVLDVEMDANHNRSVITFVAEPEAAKEAAFRMAGKAAERIDMNVHRGEHPRIGALDVLPYSTLAGVDGLQERLPSEPPEEGH